MIRLRKPSSLEWIYASSCYLQLIFCEDNLHFVAVVSCNRWAVVNMAFLWFILATVMFDNGAPCMVSEVLRTLYSYFTFYERHYFLQRHGVHFFSTISGAPMVTVNSGSSTILLWDDPAVSPLHQIGKATISRMHCVMIAYLPMYITCVSLWGII